MELVSGNLYIRKIAAPKGALITGHKHHFDHTTIVFTGAVHVRAVCPDGRVIEENFTAPAHFLVKAEVEHAITALTDGTEYWCVYAHRTPQGEVVEDFNGWTEAYS